jgi:hypothetical protein
MPSTFASRARLRALALVTTGALVVTVATLGATPTPAAAAVSADINVRIGPRPAPVVVFDREPDVVLVPRSRVYYVDHDRYDLYRYGRYWYINDDGYWFRASSYRGPFVSISVGRVPRSIVVVPARYRRHPAHPHGGPPGQMKKGRAVYRDDRHHDHDHDRRGAVLRDREDWRDDRRHDDDRDHGKRKRNRDR